MYALFPTVAITYCYIVGTESVPYVCNKVSSQSKVQGTVTPVASITLTMCDTGGNAIGCKTSVI